MSATGRNRKNQPKTERDPLSNYPTPPWVSRMIVQILGGVEGRTILEPAAGDGRMAEVLEAAGGIVTCVEIDPARAEAIRTRCPKAEVYRGDFLHDTLPIERFDLVVTNPPYGVKKKGEPFEDLVLHFANQSFKHADTVVFLLRFNWAGSAVRHAWHVEHPADLHVLSNRPYPDATEYAVWIWRRGQRIGTISYHLSDEPQRGRRKGEPQPRPKRERPAKAPKRAKAKASKGKTAVERAVERMAGTDEPVKVIECKCGAPLSLFDHETTCAACGRVYSRAGQEMVG